MKRLTSLRRRIILIFPLLFTATFLFSQVKEINGVILDAQNRDPVIGATVKLAGTTTGTITDNAGNFILSAGPDDVLEISFVGYENAEVSVDDQVYFEIFLSVDLTELEEIVVVGYGVQKKEDLTGSVAVVDVDEMTKSNFSTFDKALQGRAAGVHVSNVSGKPGELASVKIRGVGSINQYAEPLYVIDGIPADESALRILNPNDIESTQVLKDASATAIYGARGANGVIIINTKKGNSEGILVNFSATTSISTMPRTFDMMNADEYTEYMEIVYGNYLSKYPGNPNTYRNVYSDSARAANNNLGTDTNWQEEMTQTGINHNYNLSVSGGNERSRYYISGNYTNEEGVIIDTDLERFSLRANSEFNLSDRITIGESIGVSRLNVNDESHLTNFNSLLVATIASPYMPLYDENATGGFGGPTDTLTGNNERTNPVAEQLLNRNDYFENRIMSSVFANIEILKGFTYELKLGYNLWSTQTTQWSPEYTLGNLRLRDNARSKLDERNSYNTELNFTNILRYENNLGNHNFGLMAAYEIADMQWEYINAVGNDIVTPDLPVLDQAETATATTGGKEEHKLESYLARLNYDYLGKYLLTASVRVDGSTRFGPLGGRYGTFPSFSAGWKLNEDFLRNSRWINLLKVRAGWGQTGNENLLDYWYFALLDPPINSRYTFGVNQDLYLSSVATSFQSNPYIKWEAAEMINLGVDLNAFANRLQVTAEYYVKNQRDMLVQKSISTTFGKYVAYGPTTTVASWANIGRVQNRGFEFNGSWRKLEGDFNYTVSLNFSTMKNEVMDLGESDDIFRSYTITTEGHTIGSFYGHVAERILQEDDFLKDEEGNLVVNSSGEYTLLHAEQESGTSPGDIKFKDLNNDGVINDLDRTIIGKSLPDFVYGFNFDASWKGFDFMLFLQGMQNMQVYSDHLSRISLGTDRYGKDENKLVSVLDTYWSPENPTNEQTRANVIDENLNARISSWFIKDASFLRIKTLQLGYRFPETLARRLMLESLRVYASVNNLYTFTQYEGYDPEIGSKDPLVAGIDFGYYPIPRIYMFGIQLNF